MDNLSQKEMAKNNERETTCRGLSDRESLSLFRLIKRMVLETMLQSNLEDLKRTQAGFTEHANLLCFDMEAKICAEVINGSRSRELDEPLLGESDDE
jgi:hypothetical protein